ncbi:hypothetical protein CC80DRAFT_459523, partial [Byssothecium circinans]
MADLRPIIVWLYEGKPPIFNKAADIDRMCRLWLLCRQLGLWRMANTLLRLGMACAQPKNFRVHIDYVKHVYDSTEPGDKLRGFMVAMFAQRSTVAPHFFTEKYEGLGILRDTAGFLKVLGEVRRRRGAGRKGFALDQVFVKEGEEGDKDGDMPSLPPPSTSLLKLRILTLHSMPWYLIWGPDEADVPDKYFFLTEEEGIQGARDVVSQM